jgi:hypothetical protein
MNTTNNNTDTTKITKDVSNIFDTIFNKSNVALVIWFLAIYFVSYFILGFFFKTNQNSSNYQANLSRTFDILILGLLLIFLVVSYLSMSDSSKETVIVDNMNQFINYINEPTAIFSCAGFILIFYLIVYLFRIPMIAGSKSIFVSIIEGFAWKTLLIIIFVDFFKYALGKNITDSLVDFYNSMPSITPKQLSSSVSGNVIVGNAFVGNTYLPKSSNEVFNISNNLYSYDDAQVICKSYGASLATYDQIEKAYNDGAEWCNYGWSDGQMAYFPTQKSTWKELQKSPSRKNNCGRPGINGGYMSDPNMKFGVNCYGKKPKPTDMDLARMTAKKHTVYPKTNDEIRLEKRVQFWKENSDKLLNINSYNDYKWSAVN